MATPFAFALRTQAQWLEAAGLTIANLYLCEDANTQLTDAVGSDDLTVAGGMFEAATSWPPRVGVAFEGAGEYAHRDVFDDDGATSQAFILFCETGSAATNNGLFARNVNAASAGYRAMVRDSTGGLRWRLRDSVPNNVEAEIAEDHRGYAGPMAFVIDRDSDLLRVHSTLGSDTASIAAVGSAASVQPFELGIARGTANGLSGNRDLVLARVAGANAEGVDWDAVIAQLAQDVATVRAIPSAGGVGLV